MKKRSFLWGFLLIVILIFAYKPSMALAIDKVPVIIHHGSNSRIASMEGQGGSNIKLSARALSQLTGVPIKWNHESQTVIWGEKDNGILMRVNDKYLNVIKGASGNWYRERYGTNGAATMYDGSFCIPLDTLKFFGIKAYQGDDHYVHLEMPNKVFVKGDVNFVWRAGKSEYPAIVKPQNTGKGDPYVYPYPQKIGTYTTTFNSQEKSRTHNIRLAAAALNKTIIPAKGNFSFNRQVGERTPERGYQKAIIFVNKNKVMGYGGGVCQVSSTLYNTALKSGFYITERHSHSLPVSYVPKGRDATVAWGNKDLKFVNNRNVPVRIVATVDGNKLTISFWTKPN